MSYNNYNDDCIHLHACRRLCAMHNINSRGCNDNCTAYVSNNNETKSDDFKTYEEYIMNDLKNFKNQVKEQFEIILNLQEENTKLNETIGKYKEIIETKNEDINKTINDMVERKVQAKMNGKEGYVKSMETKYKNKIAKLEEENQKLNDRIKNLISDFKEMRNYNDK